MIVEVHVFGIVKDIFKKKPVQVQIGASSGRYLFSDTNLDRFTLII